MPSMDHPAFLKEVQISAYPDPAVTLECADDYRTHWYVPPGTYAGHQGLDAYSSWHAPIYAVADGIVVETITSARGSGGRYGGEGSGTYVAIQTDGCIGCMGVTAYKHLTDFMVSVGQHVSARQQIGRQGTTGNSSGEHLHFDHFIGPDKDRMERYDPVPYLQGIKSWKVIKQVVTPPEVTGVNVKIDTTYNITDPEGLVVRATPGTGTVINPGLFYGNKFDATELRDAPSPSGVIYTWAQHSRGWSALGKADGSEMYVEVVPKTPGVDNSAEILRLNGIIGDQVAQINAQNAQIGGLVNEVAVRDDKINNARVEAQQTVAALG
jgi:hypothetical protein